MAKYFIAKSVKGHEYLYSKNMVILVPDASAHKICNVLNDNNYKLKDGEIWFVHERDITTDLYASYEIKSYSKKALKIWAI